MAAARLHLAFHLDGLDTAKLAPALQSAILLGASLAPAIAAPRPNANQPGAAVTPGIAPRIDPRITPGISQAVDHAAVRQLLLALPGLISGLQIEESADGISLGVAGATLALAHAGLGMSANAPDGLLQAKLDVALDGLTVPTLPLAFADLLPRHIALRPTVSGLDLSALLALAERTTSERATADGKPADVATLNEPDLFGPTGLLTSIDRFSLDVGPATLTGNGHVTLQRNQPAQGSGHLSMAGFDALMTLVGQSPALRQALPVFILAKGLAHTDGENLVWDISYDNGKTTINGTDLTALLPATK